MELTIVGANIAVICSLGWYYSVIRRGRYSIFGRMEPYERQALYAVFALGGLLLARSIVRLVVLGLNPEHIVQLIASIIVSLLSFLSIRRLDRPDS